MNIHFDSMNPIYVLILILVFLTIIYILVIEPRLNRKKVNNKNEHGSAKFADKKEIKRTFKCEKINNINEAGFPISYEIKKGNFEKVYFDNSSPHFVVVGSTGSGKSVTLVIPECIFFAKAKNKHSVVVTDPKGEIFNATSKIFQENGYDVITIDFRNPTLSNKINLMQPIIDEWILHCEYDKKLFISLCYLIKKCKIDLDILEEQKEINYQEELINKYNINKFLIDYIILNITKFNTTINSNSVILNDKTIFENEFDIKSKSLDSFFDSLKLNELLELIKKFQNISSSHQAEANRLVITLANLIFVEKKTPDPFWLNSSKNLFTGLSGIFLEDYKKDMINKEKVTVSSIKKFQNSTLLKENHNNLMKNLNQRKYGSLSKDYLTSILSSSDNTYKSIVAVFGEKANIFDSITVEHITSESEFEFTQLGKKPTALYIIVADEDKSFFQLVTIIVGMLYQDLVKFANANGGTLPVKVEWILDEFANCPPLDSIETIVSVARSRGMRFQFFIQSFSQLEQVYSKEIANIILDNSALCYLKTNNYETAEVICKRLGKSTIETNSINQNTDMFKIGGNKTTSLMGRELLTANEIMGLKYKTIIFPTVSNPIFRDTYLFDSIYPNTKRFNPIERKINLLSRNNSNYYTVENLQYNYENEFSINLLKEYEKFKKQELDSNKNQKIKLTKIEQYIEDIKKILKFSSYTIKNNIYQIKIDKLINVADSKKIKDLLKPKIFMEIASDISKKITYINIMDFKYLKTKKDD